MGGDRREPGERRPEKVMVRWERRGEGMRKCKGERSGPDIERVTNGAAEEAAPLSALTVRVPVTELLINGIVRVSS